VNGDLPMKAGPFGYPNLKDTLPDGVGNKAIALKNCRNVVLRDFTIYHGGHFAVLATGVDNMTVDRLRIDTNRDGIDVDCCRNVRVSNCIVNSQFDDGICLKASFALGRVLSCENVTVSNCHVSGYDEGSMLDGTFRKESKHSIKGGPVGRIKCGTESTGGFKNVTITNCQFDFCRGLALETVDGGWLEDVTVSNLTMRDMVSTPIYVRLGHRGRAPEGRDQNGKPAVAPGRLRRVHISQVVVQSPNSFQGVLIDGTKDSPIEDLSLSNIYIGVKGGVASTAPIVLEEMDQVYPEPFHWGALPAWGLWARHVRNLSLRDVEVKAASADGRPAVGFVDVVGVTSERVRDGTDGKKLLLQLN
jgi:polygalacturonase